MIFDRYANVVAQHQIEFPQYYPQPGWHEHNVDEMMETCDACIDRACDELEKLGWTRESVKAIGESAKRHPIESTRAPSHQCCGPMRKVLLFAPRARGSVGMAACPRTALLTRPRRYHQPA